MGDFLSTLLNNKTSWGCVTACKNSDIDNVVYELQRLHGDLVFRFLRAKRCKISNALFQEFAASLQFPYYFGENWDALNDCLNDLEWLSAKGYIIVISESDFLLNSEKNRIPTLIELFSETSKNWSEWTDTLNPGPPLYIPFKVVFHFSSHKSQLMSHLIDMGIKNINITE